MNQYSIKKKVEMIDHAGVESERTNSNLPSGNVTEHGALLWSSSPPYQHGSPSWSSTRWFCCSSAKVLCFQELFNFQLIVNVIHMTDILIIYKCI